MSFYHFGFEAFLAGVFWAVSHGGPGKSQPGPSRNLPAALGDGANKMKRLFIASHSRPTAREVMDRLTAAGHTVTSRWITEDTRFERGLVAYTEDELRHLAVIDEEDVRAAVDGVVLIAEPEGQTVPGGKHVESGIALALGRPVYVLGRAENLFHWHPLVHVVPDLESLVATLGSVGLIQKSHAAASSSSAPS